MSFCSGKFIADCLESLLSAGYPRIKVVVVENDSPDDSASVIADWAGATDPVLRDDWPYDDTRRAARPLDFAEYGPGEASGGSLSTVTLIHTGANLGFAGGSNVGLRALLADPEIELFWNLNPDTVVESGTPYRLAKAARDAGDFALLGGRIVYFAEPERIQLDGGILAALTAAPGSISYDAPADTTPAPVPGSIDFVSGASMVASRAFVEKAGLMDESYFLYYEEIDWQLRRGDLPIVYVPGAVVRHHAGATIGSGGLNKPSPFSVYFTNLNLLRFTRRWFPLKLPFAYLFAWLRMLRRLDGSQAQFAAFLAGLHHRAPPASVRNRLPEEIWSTVLPAAGVPYIAPGKTDGSHG